MKKYDVAIVGGGASGLACAVILAENSDLRTVILEAGGRIGKKLASTGNGQGNVSNLDLDINHYFGGNKQLVEKIACGNPYEAERIFDCVFSADERGRIYPAGRQASALCDNLLRRLAGKAEILLSTPVKNIESGFILETEKERIAADYVVIGTGGSAQPVTKGISPYALAEKFGHTHTALYPSLVQIKTDTAHIKTLRGIRADCEISAYSDGKFIKSTRGDVIFTEYGISGNAVFALSPYITDKRGVTLSLAFLPDIAENALTDNLKKRRKAGCNASDLLSGTLHNQIGRAIIARSGEESDEKIVKMLKNFTLSVKETLGFAYAQVTRGGIKMTEITDELESKLVKNLFFAGEVLDVDGDCGGYNLQWAFTSGMYVAENLIKRAKK